MTGLKVEGKPHLTFSKGFWGVWWCDITEDNVDLMPSVWDWVAYQNQLIVQRNHAD